MKAWISIMAAGSFLVSLAAWAQEAKERDQPLSLRLSDEVIEKAVRETLAEQKSNQKLQSGKALSGDPYQKFERGFSEARKPDCLHPDALKFQGSGHEAKNPNGYNFVFGGLFALPFWAAAIARGKCN
jgi:hypothetical protein